MLNREKLVKLVQSNQKVGNQKILGQLRTSLFRRQKILAKKVYNPQSRNIKAFINQWRLFNRKLKQPAQASKNPPPPRISRFGRTLRYDDNELLELKYDIQDHQLQQNTPRRSTYMRIPRSGFSSNSFSQPLPLDQPMSHHTNLSKDNQNKIPTTQKKIQSVKQIRHSVIRRPNISLPSQQTSNIKFIKNRQKGASLVEDRIHIEERVLQKMIKQLHRLSQCGDYLRKGGRKSGLREYIMKLKLDFDDLISEDSLNWLIERRYDLHTTHLEDEYEINQKKLKPLFIPERTFFQTPLLSSLTGRSILSLIKSGEEEKMKSLKRKKERHKSEGIPIQKKTLQAQKTKNKFALPFCEFISQKQTRATIFRLLGMTSRQCLRVAFNLYDKDGDGTIGESDLLQIINLTGRYPDLQADVLVLAKAMLPSDYLIRFIRSDTIQSRAIFGKETIQNITYFPNEHQEELRACKSSRFAIDKLYTFLSPQEQGQSVRVLRNQNGKLKTLGFSAFCLAFQQKRPQIFLDLMGWLMGEKDWDIQKVQKIQREEGSIQERWRRRLLRTQDLLQEIVGTKIQV